MKKIIVSEEEKNIINSKESNAAKGIVVFDTKKNFIGIVMYNNCYFITDYENDQIDSFNGENIEDLIKLYPQYIFYQLTD